MNSHHIEPVIQVLPERSRSHLFQQVAIGRGDDADVDRAVHAVGADTLQLPGLEKPEQNALHPRAHLPDFVEKDRAVGRGFEQPRFVPIGVGEAAADVAEKLRLQQRVRKRLTPPRTLRALDSAIILSGPEREFKPYARDVTDLPLRAELVTVSACRSAGERAFSGEGLIGFAWAFLRAGTKRVVAGLWDVDDRSTAELMDRFYERLATGASPASAFAGRETNACRARRDHS